MHQLKSIIAPILYVRFKYLFNKNLEKSRRYFSMLLSLRGAKNNAPQSVKITESDFGVVLIKLQRQRQSIELGKRIEQISSAG